MGIKFLRFYTIPWCFHVMGNQIPGAARDLPSDPSLRTVKLIKSDGHVKIYHRPVNASELMLEFPKHLICRSDSFFIGQKIPALSEEDELKLGHKYFLLPRHFFQSVLSFVTIASFAASSSSSSSSLPSLSNDPKKAFIKKAASCKPFDIEKTPSGALQIRVSDEFISKLMEEGSMREEEEEEMVLSGSNSSVVKGRVCTTPQLQKDYTQLVGCRRSIQWRPKLETISEKERRRLGSFGKRNKKSKSKGTENGERREHQKAQKKGVPAPPPPPPPPPLPPVIKRRKGL